MYHPTTRVLAVLELLQAHGRMTGAALAARLEVNIRTLRRYVTMLQDLGIPVVAERGRHGAYALAPGFKLPPMMFTNPEALALTLGLLAARRLGLAEAAPAAESAQAKLERVLPVELRAQVQALGDAIALDLDAAASDLAAPGEALVSLSQAAQLQQRVRLHYRSGDGAVSERPFDPYGLVYVQRRWYAVGYCGLRWGLRSFRLDRLLAVKPTSKRFERPAGFDALAYAEQALARVPRAHRFEVFVEAGADEARAVRLGRLGELSPEGEGVLLRGWTDDLDWLARQLAGLPFEFTIHAPGELRAAVRERGEQLVSSTGRTA